MTENTSPRGDRHRLTVEHLEAMSAAQLVEMHNSFSPEERHVKRFADKKTAVRRTHQAFARHQARLAEQRVPQRRALGDGATETERRSSAATLSWQNPVTHKLRASRMAVRAAGQEYRSTAAAFRDLKLEPYLAHIGFRARLRDEGIALFTSRDGRVVTFELVKEHV